MLKSAIERALIVRGKATTKTDEKPNNGETALFASDGEGYEVVVECHNDVWGCKAPEDSYWNKEKSYPQYLILERQSKV